MTETITDTEVIRRTFVATCRGIGSMTHYVVGPVLVDVVITCHDSDTRPYITPTYSVKVDGAHRFGGPESHLDERGLPSDFERLFLNPREIIGGHKRDAGGPGADWCPTCGRRVRDFDEDGMEADDGQRWCQVHHAGHQAAEAVLDGLEADGILQRVVECEWVDYGYPHPGCAEFGPPDEIGCSVPATHEASWLDFDGYEVWTERRRLCARHAFKLALDDLTEPAPYTGGRAHVAELAR